MGRGEIDLATRLAVFVDAGLIEKIPTWSQIRQGELEMLPYVLSSSITKADAYSGSFWSHPLVRQPVLLAQVGRDHARAGFGIESKLVSLIKHLHLTYHQGMPSYDLQLIQTHEDGLDIMTEATERILAEPENSDARLAKALLSDPRDYHQRFLGEDGWIERARRFDYPEDDCGIPAEFSSIIAFVNHCARAYPKIRPKVGGGRLRADYRLVSRMFREGGRLGWFDKRPRSTSM